MRISVTYWLSCIHTITVFNPYESSVLANSADPDKTPHNATSSQGLHYMLTECSRKVRTKMITPSDETLNGNGSWQIDKIGIFHPASIG